MSVTISDVAKDAGVSIATVSRALNESSRVTEETRQHVLDSVRKLGYVPARAATSLASGKTHCIGIIIPDISRWFFSAVLEGIEQALRPADFDALIFSLPASTGPRVRLDIHALEGRVDGLILASVLPNEDEVEDLKRLNLPIVFLSTRQEGFSHVGIDDFAAAQAACNYLISLGHSTIGFLAGRETDTLDSQPAKERLDGWHAALDAAGLEHDGSLTIPTARMTADNGYTAMMMLLYTRPDITAVLAASDELAMGAIHALRDQGIDVGTEVSVVGIDGHDLSESFGLSTVSQPVREEGTLAARLILKALSEHAAALPAASPDDIQMRTHLIPRSTTGPVNLSAANDCVPNHVARRSRAARP